MTSQPLQTRNTSTREHTILIIDDEIDILDALYRLFRRDYNILTTTDVDEAFGILKEHSVSLVMSDQRLFQRLTGVEFLSEVRERFPDTVRMLFTGYSSLEAVVDAINSGHVYGYITKPWTPKELKARVAQAIEHFELKQDRKHLLHELKLANQDLERKNKQLALANRDLQDLDKMKTVFMEIVSHELNTPIAIILGYTFLLQQEFQKSTGDNSPGLESINTSALRLKNIAQKIFTVMSTEQDTSPDLRGTLQLENVSIHGILQQVHQTVQPFLEKRGQSVLIEASEELTADLDPPKIQDALYNLVMNAIKFSPDGYTITLRAELAEDPEQIIIKVIDEGTGIQERDLPRIFQSFFGTFNSWHHSSGDFEFEKRGIGLGLTIVKRFIEMHGGQIEVNTEIGAGSTFTIHLPRRQTDNFL